MLNWVVLLSLVNFIVTHVLNYDSVTVCDGVAKQIQCPNQENIHILQGFYGKWRNRDCKGEVPDPENFPTCRVPREKATGIAKQLCQGQNTCKLISDKSIFGDPCPRSKAYLYVTFFCMAQGQKLRHQRTKFNEEVVTVPSHGFVVKETKHHLEEDILKEEQKKQKSQKSLPPSNPTPDQFDTDAAEAKIMQSHLDKLGEPARTLSYIQSKPMQKSLLPLNVAPMLTGEGTMDDVYHPDDPSVLGFEHHDELPVIDSTGRGTKVIVNEDSDDKKRELLPKPTLFIPVVEKSSILSDHTQTIAQTPDNNTEGSAVESDSAVRNFRSMTICNGQSKLIACLPDEYVKIYHAFYGKRSGEDCLGDLPYKDESPTCSALDAKTNVKNSCDGKQTCLLFADDNIYGKSLCPNVNKYLFVQYTCDDEQKMTQKTVKLTPQADTEEDAVSRSVEPHVAPMNLTSRLCNGERQTLKCDQEQGLMINDVFYGKREGKDCKGDLTYRDDIPECKTPDALKTIKMLCEAKRSCELASESAVFGENLCPGVNKYLEVTYTC